MSAVGMTMLVPRGCQVITAGSEPTSEYRVQYYTPGYLLSGKPQPSITQAPTSLGYNAPFTVSYTLASPATITRQPPAHAPCSTCCTSLHNL